MGRKVGLLALVLMLCGCMSGPSYLSRSVDDTMNTSYGDSPTGTAILTDVIPVYPLVKALAWVPDFLILNPVQFWGSDVWEGKGAAFRHKNPRGSKQPWFK